MPRKSMHPEQAEFSRIHTRNFVLKSRTDLSGPNALFYEEASSFLKKIDDFISRHPSYADGLADMRRFWEHEASTFAAP